MMDAQRYEQMRRVVLAASELGGDERAGYIESECDGDDALRREVEDCLHSATSESETAETVTIARPRPTDDAEYIGPYRLIRRLGVGGFGVVFEARQQRPIQRTVAVKVVRAGFDTEAVMARFEAERQALAVMDHPGIARVLDAGIDDRGRPYFAMELVRGEGLLEFCDAKRLGISSRIELFIEICEAVQHAHSKGVIHRDLKPSNILAYMDDLGRPRAKVIDFGIAKALVGGSVDALVTKVGSVIGTPAYMSPEQASAGKIDVDTRTDVYSLGVILFELLTGERPFDTSGLPRGHGGDARAILDRKPVLPSSRISAAGGSRDVAAARSTDASTMRRRLRGDLDWLVLQAIETDRERRYPTPLALAEDLRRYRRGEPVDAGPPTRLYRLSKYVRRHRGPLAAACVLLITGSSAVGGAAWALAEREEAADSARIAERRRDEALAVADRLGALLAPADLLEFGVLPRMHRDVLVEAHETWELSGFPSEIAEAELRSYLGRALLREGTPDKAIAQLRRSVELREQLRDEPRAAAGYRNPVALTLDRLALVAALVSADRFDQAHRVAAAAKVDTGAVGPAGDASFATQFDVLIAEGHRRRGEPEIAARMLRRVDEKLARSGALDPDMEAVRFRLALALADLGESEEARRLLEQVVAARRRLDPRSVLVLEAELALARVRVAAGDREAAETLLAETRERAVDALPPTHPLRLEITWAHARSMIDRSGPGDAAQGFELMREAIAGFEPPDRPTPRGVMRRLELVELLEQRGGDAPVIEAEARSLFRAADACSACSSGLLLEAKATGGRIIMSQHSTRGGE